MAQTSHVLARKYRPQIFADLVGQEALVRTITNAIEQNRLAHAYMLTGIRGVGKTSSARIIAKGLNCIGEDGNGAMTPNPCGKCKHCVEISNDSHMDVIEIDAASNTGVDNIREIIESAKYNPVSARFKIFIIDEVHMLSKAAFNALLKTLEEPPERIKFILATTEIRKVPITILSRCQRFDLKRLDETDLTQHLASISKKENITFEEEALRLIARAGSGSCRDSLSLLDQAMTQFNYNLKADDVRSMLGVTDRLCLFDIFEHLMKGEVNQALEILKKQSEIGSDPLATVQDLLSITHLLTRTRLLPEAAEDISMPKSEQERAKKLAENLSMPALTSAWQLLFKGASEVKMADNPDVALEMVLIRLAFLADLPPLTKVIEDIKKNTLVDQQAKVSNTQPQETSIQNLSTTESTLSATQTQTHTQQQEEKKEYNFKMLSDIVNLAKEHKERLLAFNIETYVRLNKIEGNKITCAFTEDTPRTFCGELTRFLKEKTGINWELEFDQSTETKTLKEKKDAHVIKAIEHMKQTEPVKTIFELFPNAKVAKVKLPPELNVEEDIDEEEIF